MIVSCTLLACTQAAPRAGMASGRGMLGTRAPLIRVVSAYAYEWFTRAELLAAQGQTAAAIEAYRMALASGDDDAFVLARMALAQDRLGEHDAAAEALRAGLEIDPESEAVWLVRGDLAREHGDPAAAFSAYERAELNAEGSAAGALALSDLLADQQADARSLAVLERLAARLPRASTPALLARAELALARGDHGVLLGATAALGRAPAGRDWLRRAASQLLSDGHPALAARLADALPDEEQTLALRLRIALALGWRERAELLLANGALAGSAEALERADAFLSLAQPARALEELARDSEARASAPHRHAVLEGRARLALGDLAAAALAFARVPHGSAEYPAALTGLGQVRQAGGLDAILPAPSRH